MGTNHNQIDESLYSRQMYVYGESMKKICDARILLVNPMSLGVEVAKNLILSGVKQLDVLSNGTIVDELQYGTNMYITKEDIGNDLAETVVLKLKELNPYVSVNIIKSITAANLCNYQAVVVLDKSFQNQLDLNSECHKQNVPYISGNTYGLTGLVFNDFGEKFAVHDTTGENIKQASVGRAYVHTDDDKIRWIVETGDNHDMSSNDYITLHNTQTEESAGPYKIIDIKRSSDGALHTLYLTCPENNPELTFIPELFNSYGEMREVKQTEYVSFKPLVNALVEPAFATVLYEHMERQVTLHALYQMFGEFMEIHNRFPYTFNDIELNMLLELNKDDKYIKKDELDMKVLNLFLNHAGVVPAVISVIGSIVSQEVLKAVTNKYMPMQQFMYFESFDSLPEFISPEDHSYNPEMPRYAYMTNVFGREFTNKMLNLNMFMVGCGAIGCELLKNFALMGVSSGKGMLTVTDPDTIERSNLNRQFLFRSHNIGQFKSEAATVAIKQMNPDINIVPHQNKVGPDSEDVYDYDFYAKQDIITNALDNINARTYVDNKCVENGLPLLESGTLGVKGNVQVVIPHKSESYSSSSDPPEKDIPVCTLKNFPFQIEHTSHWALDLFEGLFVNAPSNVNKYLENPLFVNELGAAELDEVSRNLVRYSVEDVPSSTSDCVVVAVKYFNHYFFDSINELLKQFPVDSTTSSGLPFWSGSKRCPQSVMFNPECAMHIDFVNHFVHLHAKMYGLKVEQSITKEFANDVLKGVSIHLTYPVTEKFAANDEEEKANQEAKKSNTSEREDILMALHPDNFTPRTSNLISEAFEKDDDMNHHIDFISTVANLRATNYHITVADRHKIKGIVGRIIPAVATTTALVAGLVSLELCKLVAGHTNLEQFRNAFINLGLGFIAFSEPVKTSVQKLNGKEYTMWDQLDIKGPMTMKQFRENVHDFYGCDVDTVNYGKISLYMGYGNLCNPVERDKEDMSNIFSHMNIPINRKSYLPLSIMLDTDEDFEEPDVRYWPN